MRRYLMRAKDSVTAAVYTWQWDLPDFAALGYPGPNVATNTLCTGVEEIPFSREFTTADATVTTALTLPVPSGKTLSIGVRWSGRLVSGTNQALRESTLVVRRVGAAAPVQWGTTNDVFPVLKDDGTWGNLDFSISGNDVLIRVTGKAATNIKWAVEAWVRTL
jgi:hypothetical protein